MPETNIKHTPKAIKSPSQKEHHRQADLIFRLKIPKISNNKKIYERSKPLSPTGKGVGDRGFSRMHFLGLEIGALVECAFWGWGLGFYYKLDFYLKAHSKSKSGWREAIKSPSQQERGWGEVFVATSRKERACPDFLSGGWGEVFKAHSKPKIGWEESIKSPSRKERGWGEVFVTTSRKERACPDFLSGGWGEVFNKAIALLLCAIVCACSNTKYLAPGEQLYTGAEIKIVSATKIKGKKAIVKEALKAVKPKPNGSILGLKPKLWIYNIAPNTTKETGFKHWLKYEVGEPPVLFSDVNPTGTSEFIAARVFNKGFFKSNVSYESHQNKEKTKTNIVYSVFLQKPFVINEIDYNSIADQAISNVIQKTLPNTLLKTGMTYDLDLLRAERVRIDNELKNNGYFYFSPDYLYFKIDSSSKETNLNISLNIKPDAPKKGLSFYWVGEIMIHVDSSDYDHSYILNADTVQGKDSIFFVKNNPNFRVRPITKSVFMKVGYLYSRKEHNQTLSRLGSLGVFKYVNLRITEDSARPQHLKVSIELNPTPKHGVSAEFEAATKSNNFIGPSANLSYMNRNLYRGAEKLNVSLHGSIETQFNGRFRGLYTYEIGPQIKYTLPRFLLPFRARAQQIAAPTTQFMVDYTFSKRVNYFDLNSLKFGVEYRWKETVTKEHVVSPFNITYLNITNISDDFNNILATNPFLKQRYNDQLIAGITYSFTYNEQIYESKKNQFYFNGNIDIAGNGLALINALAKPNDTQSPKRIAGVTYAQYAKFDVDIRDFYNINPKTKLATRLIVGVGIPYGNSTALPYIKGFFAGGTNSLRAFPINSVGPGTYHLPDSLLNSFFLQQGGDIKLEWNGEFRFPIIGFLRGALFVDVGNTWLMRDNLLLPGGKFDVRSFYKQLAVGTGFGLRADFNFFVIRLDLGIPLRKPWLPVGQEWVIDKIQFDNGSWRSQNLILNIAIGYPF